MSTLAAIGAACAVLAMLIGWAVCCMSGQCSEVERREADRRRRSPASTWSSSPAVMPVDEHQVDERARVTAELKPYRGPDRRVVRHVSQDELRQIARDLVEHDCSMGNLCDWPACPPACPWLRSAIPRPVEGASGEPAGGRRTAGKLRPSRALPCPSPSRLAALGLLLGLSGCSVMERASVQPLCLAFCQIQQHEREGVLNVRRR